MLAGYRNSLKKMWQQVVEKIEQLKTMDKSLQLFGAEAHEYGFKPTATQEQIGNLEEKFAVALPEELKSFYTNLGNGIVGPDYGLLPLDRLVSYQANKPFQGAEYFRKIAEAEGELSQDGYFEANHEDIQGLISIIEQGCGHQICLVSKGEEVGKVVYFSCDGYIKEAHLNLWELYNRWLDESIEAFVEVEILLHGELSMKQINQRIQEKFNYRYSGQNLAISLMGVKKPESLFGSRYRKIYGGIGQSQWYEKQLQEYRSGRN